MANKENLPPRLATPQVNRISPSNKPALGRQRDHSACRADTPLKVKKTRENLKQASLYDGVPPPCVHVQDTRNNDRICDHQRNSHSVGPANAGQTSRESSEMTTTESLMLQQQYQHSSDTQPKVPRQKSVSRRMLSRVKQGIVSRSKSSQSIRPTGSETSLARMLSGRRKPSSDAERHSQSFELSRNSIESTIDEEIGVSAETPPLVQRSFTDSTVSTSEILEDVASSQVPSLQTSYIGASIGTGSCATQGSASPPTPSPSPQPTPRPLGRSSSRVLARTEHVLHLTAPCVDLKVTADSTSVDVNSRRDVWISIMATVRLKTINVTGQHPGVDTADVFHEATENDMLCTSKASTIDKDKMKRTCGTITNLRLCYKPAVGCRIRNMVGQKSYKDLAIGQQCTIFIKIGIPKMQTACDALNPDQESLFAELESIVGTLETDLLHVEARYRHSMLPSDNIVALKHTCKVWRPRTESRWSIIGLYEKEDPSSDVHARLAQYLADHYAAEEALEILHRYFDFDTRSRKGMTEVCAMLQNKLNVQCTQLNDRQPAVVVTDIDLATATAGALDEDFASARSTSLDSDTPENLSTTLERTGSSSLLTSSKLAPPTLSARGTTTALTTSSWPSSPPPTSEPAESHDSARQLWRHIRRTSQSAKQLEEMTPERLSRLEAGDDSLRELRRRAVANKRSVGAETLRTWRWEADMHAKERPAEAPWM